MAFCWLSHAVADVVTNDNYLSQPVWDIRQLRSIRLRRVRHKLNLHSVEVVNWSEGPDLIKNLKPMDYASFYINEIKI